MTGDENVITMTRWIDGVEGVPWCGAGSVMVCVCVCVWCVCVQTDIRQKRTIFISYPRNVLSILLVNKSITNFRFIVNISIYLFTQTRPIHYIK